VIPPVTDQHVLLGQQVTTFIQAHGQNLPNGSFIR